MKNNIYILIFIFLLTFSISFAQDYIYFNDSSDTNYYDPSWGFFQTPSQVELINDNKFPVSTTTFYFGLNSLKLNWTSQSGGDWGLAVASPGWVTHNVNKKDSIIFMAFSPDSINAIDLPVIFIEDVNNTKTPHVKLSDFNNDLNSQTWTKLSVPLNVFKDNPGSVDLTQIKTIFFGQSVSDTVNHTMFLDNIRMVSAASSDTTAPSVPQNVSAKGYDSHIDILWDQNPENDLKSYFIYKVENNTSNLIATVPNDIMIYTDYIGQHNVTASYRVSAVDSNNNESFLSSEVSAATFKMNDEQLLNMVEEATFRYFWNNAHPISGLIREGYKSHPKNIVTTGGSGFGLMALIVGIERGFITREEGIIRYLKILNFLTQKADRFHGAFPHWMDGETGKVIPFSQKDDGGDLVETAFLIQGLLTAREYFHLDNPEENQIRNLITQIWESVEWDWYMRNPSSSYLYWHWSPNYAWDKNLKIIGWNEAMITYLLAIASPTHSIPASLYRSGWAGSSNYLNGKIFYGIPLEVGQDYGGPLFFAHYSFLGFDPRFKKDAYTNYFNNNRNHTLINRAYCIANPKGFTGYNDSTWGLTASFDPFGYLAHAPWANDNGTITPSAAISSIVYSPEKSIAVLRNLYRTYGNKIWGIYGFKDAFDLNESWYADNYLAIDQGPIIDMIENYRSQLLWNNFMANPEIQPMLDSIGFVPDITAINENVKVSNIFTLYNNYPNPFNSTTTIKYSISKETYPFIPFREGKERSDRGVFVTMKVYDILGREVATLVNKNQAPGNYEVKFDAGNLSTGIYYYRFKAGDFIKIKKMVYLK